MDEELKKLMGDSYKENMTSDDIQNFFRNSILGDGTYVRKEKADAEIQQLKKDLENKNIELQNKMTDDEKKALADKETQKTIEELKEQLRQSTLNNNTSKAFGVTAKARIASGIKDDDKDFDKFIHSVINDDEKNSLEIAKYINTLCEKAYEKGKSDVTKNKLGKMGDFHTGNDDDGNTKNTMAEKAKELAKENFNKVKKSYFD